MIKKKVIIGGILLFVLLCFLGWFLGKANSNFFNEKTDLKKLNEKNKEEIEYYEKSDVFNEEKENSFTTENLDEEISLNDFFCGNNLCELGEFCWNCQKDCGECICNKNYFCEPEESSNSCPVDCFIKPKIKKDKIILGDYGAHLRVGEVSPHIWTTETRADIPLTIQRLKDASINSYFFLMWKNSEYDWKDFLIFVEEAEKADIDAYAYFVPPAEDCYSIQPYGCNFLEWAKEIAFLSLKHPNLKGWAIDDFTFGWSPDNFTEDYIAKMIYSTYSINPNLSFYPVLWKGAIFNESAMRNFSRFFDGAIYPFISFDFQGTDATHTCNLETSGSLEEDIETFNKNHPDLDLIIMPYAFPHSACGTPTREYLYNVTNMGIEKTRENKTIGVITYVLQKENISIDSFYDIIKRIYSKET